MTDRELLERAARAAGIAGSYMEWGPPNHQPGSGIVEKVGYRPWNPLTDDGDALRLAVKLKLSVWFEERENHQWTHIIWVSPVFEPYVDDVNAATRRAIVRAAAAMGEKE